MDSNSIIEETLQYLTQEEEEAAENSNDLLLFMNGFEDQLKEEEDEEKSKTKRTNDDEVKGKRKKVKKQVRFKPETAAKKTVEEGYHRTVTVTINRLTTGTFRKHRFVKSWIS